MDRLILAEKLASLRRFVTRIEQWRVDSSESLAADVDAQDILALGLTLASVGFSSAADPPPVGALGRGPRGCRPSR